MNGRCYFSNHQQPIRPEPAPASAVGGIETDHLVVGAGAAGMAFVDALIAACDADVVMVDRRHRPGGHWNGEEWDWLTRQVVTSRNIRSSYLTDFLYGGLNYQIEHHLFPTMPRKALRRARPITIEYCSQIGLPYHEVGVFRSYAEVVIHLYHTTKAYQRTLAAAARGDAAGDPRKSSIRPG